ncbi:hypothetical protein [Haliangium sp.]|uniref:hypothetical protein n=1 Tax=Haliangium sp. TaxID=2663208 RepID=UPI003D135A79
MLDLTQVSRDVCLADSYTTYRSAATMVVPRYTGLGACPSVPLPDLLRANGCFIVATPRAGRVLIGRLQVHRSHLTISRLVHGVPCRHCFAFDDIVAFYMYEPDEWSTSTDTGPGMSPVIADVPR